MGQESTPGLDQEYKDYFYDFIDDGWKIGLNPGLHVSVIFISKTFDNNYDSEGILNEINPILQSIKKKFVDDGFNTHYQILFNGVAQCEVNPKTNKTDIYLYKGDWDDELSRYYERGKLSVKINFFFI